MRQDLQPGLVERSRALVSLVEGSAKNQFENFEVVWWRAPPGVGTRRARSIRTPPPRIKNREIREKKDEEKDHTPDFR